MMTLVCLLEQINKAILWGKFWDFFFSSETRILVNEKQGSHFDSWQMPWQQPKSVLTIAKTTLQSVLQMFLLNQCSLLPLKYKINDEWTNVIIILDLFITTIHKREDSSSNKIENMLCFVVYNFLESKWCKNS